MSLQTWHPHILHTTQTTFSDTDQYTPPQSTLQTHESGLAIPILTTYLSTPTSSPETTAAALASICTTRIQSGDVSAPEGIWKVFCSAIDFFGGDESTRERLVALLMSLANIEVRGEDGRVVESSLNADVFWRQLPGYSLAFRDEMTCIPPIDTLPTPTPLLNWPRRLQNSASFQAHYLTSLPKTSSSPPETREYLSALNIALSHFRQALEPAIEDSELGYRRTALWIPGVVQWIFIAGREVWGLCQEKRLNDGSLAMLRVYDEGVGEMEWEGEEGFSVERWGFWRGKLGRVAGMEGVEGSVRGLAERAEREMGEIERGS